MGKEIYSLRTASVCCFNLSKDKKSISVIEQRNEYFAFGRCDNLNKKQFSEFIKQLQTIESKMIE